MTKKGDAADQEVFWEKVVKILDDLRELAEELLPEGKPITLKITVGEVEVAVETGESNE